MTKLANHKTSTSERPRVPHHRPLYKYRGGGGDGDTRTHRVSRARACLTSTEYVINIM